MALTLACTLAHADSTASQHYAEHCATCHGADRLGGTGPALIPETLSRMRGPALTKVIADGRAATQMPAFADRLSQDEIAALAEFLKTQLDSVPQWTLPSVARSSGRNQPWLRIIADTQRSSRSF